MPAPSDLLRRLLAELGEEELSNGAALGSFCDATCALLGDRRGVERDGAVSALLKGWVWSERLPALAQVERRAWPERLIELGGVRELGGDALAVLLASAPGAEAALAAVVAREMLLERLAPAADDALADVMIDDTAAAIALLELLRDQTPSGLGARVRRLFPELAALATQESTHSSVEHDRDADGVRPLPLLDHLTRRVLARKLAGLERGNRELFQRDQALSAATFAEEVALLERVRELGLMPVLRAALIHLDFAKGGTPALREQWRVSGADLTVHNRAARQILERGARLASYSLFRRHAALEKLVLALVESHGMAGQVVRGETPVAFFAPWIVYLRREVYGLAEFLRVPRAQAVAAALDCLHLVNVCDTAGVREGLLGDHLRGELLALRHLLEEVALAGDVVDEGAVERELAAAEQRRRGAGDTRARLSDRLCRLRAGRIAAGEPRQQVEQMVAALPDSELERLVGALARCQFWYAETGSAALSPETQLKVLALGLRPFLAGGGGDGAGQRRLVHVSLLPLVQSLHSHGDDADRATPYRLRLIETMLAPIAIASILDGGSEPLLGRDHPLGTFATEIGGDGAVALTFRESREAHALLTLLPIYETKSSAAFHATLKALCDLYGLRKDEFDRVANEAMYLTTMNNARSDKQRMLDHVRAGRIVEVGPGGGVVLDLLEQSFPSSEIIGIDASHMVAESLRQRKQAEQRRWSVVEADAFQLPEMVGAASVDTVVFCSVLHEIYSYVPYPDGGGVVGRFRLEAVRDLLRAAYRTLVKGGRLVIRDGVMPPPATRVLRFVAPEAREFFELFCQQFEGRPIRGEPVGEDRVRLSAADAMEFLYTYTWGPESFPYEVREQYGVLPYEEYKARILEWLAFPESPPRWVALPPAEASYLQDGYRRGLADKIELFDERGERVELPDSNCLLVFEKT